MTGRQLLKFNLRIRQGIIDKKLTKLFKHGRNNVSKSYLKRRLAHVINLTSAANSDEQTLLDLSSKNNYIDVINFLGMSGCTVNVKNSFRKTPLLTALFSNHLEAINFLMVKNADFSTNDREDHLKILMIKDVLPAPTLIAFMRKLKRCSNDLESMAGLLVKINCPLRFVVYAKDALLTQMVLQRPDYEIDNEDNDAALQCVIEQSDLENLRVVWRSDRMVESRNNFLRKLIYSGTFGADWTYMRPLFEHLTDWMVSEYNFFMYIQAIFSTANKQDIQILLEQYNVDVQLRQKYNFDLLPFIFGNQQLDIEYLTDLTRKRQFDVNAKDLDGRSALHLAGICGLHPNVRLLLELGSDCNVQDDSLRSPLFYAADVTCTKLLLQSGIDMHTTDISGSTALELAIGSSYSDISNLMLDQLAIDYYRGLPIRQTIFDKINRNQLCKNYFECCLMQMEELTTREIFPSLALFDVIAKKPKYIANQIQSQETISAITEWCSQQCFHPYYCSFFESNLTKAYNIYRTKCGVATIISKGTSNPISSDHLVVDAICDFLSYRDMLVVVSVFDILSFRL